MITTPSEYLQYLHEIQNYNHPIVGITLPKDEPIYDVDLATRTIKAPEFLSMEYDHNAETIWFRCPRYFDNTDLGRKDITAIIQYENANPDSKKRGFIYAVPFKDLVTEFDEENMLLPWIIEGPATAYSGTVQFSIKFYKIVSTDVAEEDFDKLGEGKYFEYEYNLNTLTAKSKVLHGMNVYENSENYIYNAETVEAIYQRISEVDSWQGLYWVDLFDEA